MGLINIFKQLPDFLLDNFSSEKFRECWESNPGQLGLEASALTIVLCWSILILLSVYICGKNNFSQGDLYGEGWAHAIESRRITLVVYPLQVELAVEASFPVVVMLLPILLRRVGADVF